MDIISLVGMGVLSAVLCIIVRQYKPEMALGVSIACGVLIMGAVITMLAPSAELISQLTGAAGLDSGYSRTLFKALAVCYPARLGLLQGRRGIRDSLQDRACWKGGGGGHLAAGILGAGGDSHGASRLNGKELKCAGYCFWRRSCC